MELQQAGWTDGRANKLMLMLGETHVWMIRKLILKDHRLAKYKFATTFEGMNESGIHRHITEIEFGPEFYDDWLKAYLTPTIARIDISLEAYDRLRRARERVGDRFPPYAKVDLS